MKTISYKLKISGEVEEVVSRITELLKTQGFGILTRIDLHSKIKEKLGKNISPSIILGACNPEFAYDAYQITPDVTSLLPCNVVVRQVAPGLQSVEIARPSLLLKVLDNPKLDKISKEADDRLLSALNQFEKAAA